MEIHKHWLSGGENMGERLSYQSVISIDFGIIFLTLGICLE